MLGAHSAVFTYVQEHHRTRQHISSPVLWIEVPPVREESRTTIVQQSTQVYSRVPVCFEIAYTAFWKYSL